MPECAPLTPNADRRTSDGGLAFIERQEGVRLDWYRDAVGVRTIGVGHTGPLPAGFSAPLTPASARELLRWDVARFEDCLRGYVRIPLSQNAWDALVSFTFNLGCGALSRSTLLRHLNAGHVMLAAAEFPRWNKAGGRVLPGLTRRREEERRLFLTPDPEPEPEAPDPRAGAEDVERVEPRPPQPLPGGATPPVPDASDAVGVSKKAAAPLTKEAGGPKG